MFEIFDMFPESRFFRMKRQIQVQTTCGGITSLLIIIALMAILISMLVQLFTFSTVYSTYNSIVSANTNYTTLSTYQADPNTLPYMAGAQIFNSCPSTSSIKAFYYVFQDPINNPSNVAKTEIPLEPCSAEHFSKNPTIFQNGLGTTMTCLPLNRTFEIGGSVFLAQPYKLLVWQFNCHSCGTGNAGCGFVDLLQLDTYVNVDSDQLFAFDLRQDSMDLSRVNYYQYDITLDQKTVITDNSIFPWQSLSYQKGVGTNSFNQRVGVNITGQAFNKIQMTIKKSTLHHVISRKYMKIVDVLSYVGGFFPVLISLFFFMKWFSLYFFQMSFASQHFKYRAAEVSNFSGFIKISIYSFLKLFGKEPENWKIAKKQKQTSALVTKTLGISYLYKRLEFLQTAISVLLTDRQLKGVYLSQFSLKEVNKKYKDHHLRDRVIRYLYLKAQADKEKRTNNGKMNSCDQLLGGRQLYEIELKTRQKMKTEKSSRSRGKSRSKGNSMQFTEEIPKQKEVNKYNFQRNLYQREQNLNRLRQQQKIIQLADSEDYNQLQLRGQFQNDLRLLLKEANEESNQVSLKIVKRMQKWLKNEVEIAIEDANYPQAAEKIESLKENDIIIEEDF